MHTAKLTRWEFEHNETYIGTAMAIEDEINKNNNIMLYWEEEVVYMTTMCIRFLAKLFNT